MKKLIFDFPMTTGSDDEQNEIVWTRLHIQVYQSTKFECLWQEINFEKMKTYYHSLSSPKKIREIYSAISEKLCLQKRGENKKEKTTTTTVRSFVGNRVLMNSIYTCSNIVLSVYLELIRSTSEYLRIFSFKMKYMYKHN